MAADYLRLDQIGQFQDAFMAFAASDGQVNRNYCFEELAPELGDEQGGGPHHEVLRAEPLRGGDSGSNENMVIHARCRQLSRVLFTHLLS